MIETIKLHCINDCHGNIKMKSHNLPIVIYRASTAESLDIFIVVPEVLLDICNMSSCDISPAPCITYNRPQQVFPRGLPKIFNNLLA